MTTTEQRLADALRGIVEIGKRNTENPKYDGFYAAARETLAAYDAQQARTVLPVEWRSESLRLPQGYSRIYDGGRFVACVTDEDAARIIQCVNAHDGLVSALRASTEADMARTVDGAADMSALDWITRARDSLRAEDAREENDTVADAVDDLNHALARMGRALSAAGVHHA